MSSFGVLTPDEFNVLTSMVVELNTIRPRDESDTDRYIQGYVQQMSDVCMNTSVLDKEERQKKFNVDPMWAMGYNQACSDTAQTLMKLRKFKRLPPDPTRFNPYANYGMYAQKKG